MSMMPMPEHNDLWVHGDCPDPVSTFSTTDSPVTHALHTLEPATELIDDNSNSNSNNSTTTRAETAPAALAVTAKARQWTMSSATGCQAVMDITAPPSSVATVQTIVTHTNSASTAKPAAVPPITAEPLPRSESVASAKSTSNTTAPCTRASVTTSLFTTRTAATTDTRETAFTTTHSEQNRGPFLISVQPTVRADVAAAALRRLRPVLDGTGSNKTIAAVTAGRLLSPTPEKSFTSYSFTVSTATRQTGEESEHTTVYSRPPRHAIRLSSPTLASPLPRSPSPLAHTHTSSSTLLSPRRESVRLTRTPLALRNCTATVANTRDAMRHSMDTTCTWAECTPLGAHVRHLSHTENNTCSGACEDDSHCIDTYRSDDAGAGTTLNAKPGETRVKSVQEVSAMHGVQRGGVSKSIWASAVPASSPAGLRRRLLSPSPSPSPPPSHRRAMLSAEEEDGEVCCMSNMNSPLRSEKETHQQHVVLSRAEEGRHHGLLECLRSRSRDASSNSSNRENRRRNDAQVLGLYRTTTELRAALRQSQAREAEKDRCVEELMRALVGNASCNRSPHAHDSNAHAADHRQDEHTAEQQYEQQRQRHDALHDTRSHHHKENAEAKRRKSCSRDRRRSALPGRYDPHSDICVQTRSPSGCAKRRVRVRVRRRRVCATELHDGTSKPSPHRASDHGSDAHDIRDHRGVDHGHSAHRDCCDAYRREREEKDARVPRRCVSCPSSMPRTERHLSARHSRDAVVQALERCVGHWRVRHRAVLCELADVKVRVAEQAAVLDRLGLQPPYAESMVGAAERVVFHSLAPSSTTKAS